MKEEEANPDAKRGWFWGMNLDRMSSTLRDSYYFGHRRALEKFSEYRAGLAERILQKLKHNINREQSIRDHYPKYTRLVYPDHGVDATYFEETSCVTKETCEGRGGETMPNGACAMFEESDCGSEAPVFVSKEDGCRMWRPSDCSDGTFSSFKVTGRAKDTFQSSYGETLISDRSSNILNLFQGAWMWSFLTKGLYKRHSHICRRKGWMQRGEIISLCDWRRDTAREPWIIVPWSPE